MNKQSRRNETPSFSPKRFLNKEQALKQFDPEIVNLLDEHINKTDTYADDVIDAFDLMPKGAGWKMFEQALERGIDTIENPPSELLVLFSEMVRMPEWVDMDAIFRGSVAYLRSGPLVPLALKCASLAAGYQSSAAVKPLIFTGRLIDNALQRQIETGKWLMQAIAPGGMERYSDGFKYTARVRLVHAFVRRRLVNLPEWNFEEWGQPINLTDTCYGISGEFGSVAINAIRKCGIHYSKQERKDMYAMWRYIGFVLGVPESLLMRHEQDARLHMKIKHLTDTPPDQNSIELVKALIESNGNEKSQLPTTINRILNHHLERFLYGQIRFFAGDEVADSLGVPKTAYKHFMKLIRPVIVLADRTRKLRGKSDLETALNTLDKIKGQLKEMDATNNLAKKSELQDGINQNKHKFQLKS